MCEVLGLSSIYSLSFVLLSLLSYCFCVPHKTCFLHLDAHVVRGKNHSKGQSPFCCELMNFSPTLKRVISSRKRDDPPTNSYAEAYPPVRRHCGNGAFGRWLEPEDGVNALTERKRRESLRRSREDVSGGAPTTNPTVLARWSWNSSLQDCEKEVRFSHQPVVFFVSSPH